jgi:hypothetical protein
METLGAGLDVQIGDLAFKVANVYVIVASDEN